MLKVFALCGVLVLGFTRTAQAEWHFTPMAGLTMFGNTSLLDREDATGKRHPHVGGSIALLGKGIIGAEAITIWTPGFFEQGNQDPAAVESSRALSAMANVVITTPRRWSEYSLRPFISAGFGLMHASVRAENDILPIDVSTPGFNIGGGAVGFLSERTGLRFDLRYHTTLNQASEADAPTFGPVHLRYTTASIGIVFRR